MFSTAKPLFALLSFLLSLGFLASTQPQQLVPHGSQQLYELTNKLTISDLKHTGQQSTSYTFKTELKVNSVWNSADEQLLQVYFIASEVSAPAKADNKRVTQLINKIPDRPFYISLIDGKPSKVIAHTSRDQSLLNIERGIASLLQLQFENGPVREVDVSGQCNTFYAVKSSTRIEKIKTDCSHWDLRVHYRAEKPLSVAHHAQESVNYELSADGALLRAESSETHRAALESNTDVGSQLISQLVLQHLALGDKDVEQLSHDTLELAINSLLEWYRVFDIEADVDGSLTEIKGISLKQQIAADAHKLNNSHIGTETLANTLAALLPLARITKQAEFEEILQTHSDILGQIVDLLGATQTIDAHNAIFQVFKYSEKADAELLEKYLQSLAMGTHPERAIIEHLFKELQQSKALKENEKLHDTVVQTVASLTKQYGFEQNDPLLIEIRSFVLTALDEDCAEPACKTLYIRALQNLKDLSTIPTLIEHALQGESIVSVTAMGALKSFPVVNFNETHRKAFEQIFYQLQRKYDTSSRTLALSILLHMRPTKQQLGELLDYLTSNDPHFEIKTYVIQKLRMFAEKCPRFKALFDACLAERPKVNNYHVIAQKGLTTVLTRQLSQAPAVNESLLSIQEIYQGVLKRGSVELIVNAGHDEFSTFKLGIYTNGLSSFVADENADDNSNSDAESETDDSTVTAGMEISVQGVLLRPLVFFTGQGELMGHVWRGTASEPTPAFQATTLAEDHEQYIVLSSGATAHMRFIGTKSVDLNGKVETSIWYRNANTEIHQNTGASIIGSMVAGFTYGKVSHEFTLTSEPKLSLQANIDFYSGIKLCMQLQRPELLLKYSSRKSVFLQADKPYVKHITHKVTHKFPGRTLALNQKNNEMCNMIFPSD